MQRILATLFGVIALFAVVTQYYLMMENRTASVGESTIRFFSYFTILSNTLVAIYLLAKALNARNSMLNKSGTLTAITIYITIVGIVYQFALRHLWNPQGMQMIVDELLHSLVPLLVIIYWYMYEDKSSLTYSRIGRWLVFPAFYLAFILTRGYFSGFYPYPFMEVNELGLTNVLLNALIILGLFVLFAVIFVAIGKIANKNDHE